MYELAPIEIVALAAAAIAVVAVITAFVLRGRLAEALDESRRLEAVAAKGREILSAAPDGLFLWDHVLGGITCSRRLAVLLNLKAGTHARYDDIRAAFAGESLKSLERAVSALRANGSSFDLVLGCGDRTIQAIGARAETEDGQPLADMVWMRDVSDLASGEVPKAGSGGHANTSGLDDRHLTALLDAMPLPVWLRDSKLRLAFTNRAGAGLAEQRPDMAERARKEGAPISERKLLDDGGQARLMEVTEVPLGALGGAGAGGAAENRGGTLGFAIDRSEREAMAGEAQRQQAARDSVLDDLNTAVAIFDGDKRLDYCNSAYAGTWKLDQGWLQEGPALAEILEKLREARLLPEVADFRDFKAQQLARFTMLSEAVDDLMHLPDGRTLRAVTRPYGDGGLAQSFEDVTERLDLERSFKSLGAVQNETLDNLHEGVAVFGPDGRLKLFNPVFARLWEIDEADLEGEPHLTDIIDWTRPLVPPPADAEAWSDEAWPVHRDLVVAGLLSRAAKTGQIAFTNGAIVDYANVPLPDGAVLLSYMDVTDSARVERALRERAEALQEADRLKSEFIANVSYEVRTPLNTIIGFADMLGREHFGDLNARQSDYARGILDTSLGLMSVIGDILDLASIEAGHMELERGSVDVHGVLVAAFNLGQERIRRKELKAEFDCPPDIGWMVADEKRLKQVVFNLLSNAIAFTPPRGVVRLEAHRDRDEVVIAVSDTGVGIPQAERERVFEPFARGEAGDGEAGPNEAGAGLGLTIVRNFIELHDGTVEVKSRPGRGTTVTCRVPAGPAD